MKKKKRIKIIIIAVLVVAVVAGSITGVVYYKNSKGLASVMSVSMISTTNDNTSMTSEGMVCDDACQTINLKDGQKVTEVYVTKDQQVKAGDHERADVLRSHGDGASGCETGDRQRRRRRKSPSPGKIFRWRDRDSRYRRQ